MKHIRPTSKTLPCHSGTKATGFSVCITFKQLFGKDPLKADRACCNKAKHDC
jgi:hypothetical protein